MLPKTMSLKEKRRIYRKRYIEKNPLLWKIKRREQKLRYKEKDLERWKLKNIEYNKRRSKRIKITLPWISRFYGAKDRCSNVNCKDYKNYGAKGIKCLITKDELKFIWFRDSAYNLKKPSLDRINPDGHYEFSNCRFIEVSENSKRARRIGYKIKNKGFRMINNGKVWMLKRLKYPIFSKYALN